MQECPKNPIFQEHPKKIEEAVRTNLEEGVDLIQGRPETSPRDWVFIFFVHIQQLKYHYSEFAMRLWKAKKVHLNPEKGFFLGGNLNFSQYVKRGCNGGGWMADWSTRPINESGLLHKFTLTITTTTQ